MIHQQVKVDSCSYDIIPNGESEMEVHIKGLHPYDGGCLREATLYFTATGEDYEKIREHIISDKKLFIVLYGVD